MQLDAIGGSCSWHTADFEINACKFKQSAELLPVEGQHSQLHLAASCLISMRSPSLNCGELCVLERILLSNLPSMYIVYSMHDLFHYIQIIKIYI